MKTKQLLMIGLAVATLAGMTAKAQNSTIPNLLGTNVPPIFTQATNQSNAQLIFGAVLSILPDWDPTLTNTFASGEWDIESAPLWKSETAAGTTPYNSTEGDYFFSRNVGAGVEIISLGNGTGNDTIDTLNANLTLRKDVGNIAGYLLIGGGYDVNRDKGDFAVGPGIIYGYQTHIRLFLDTRGELEGLKQQDIGWLTRVGMQLSF